MPTESCLECQACVLSFSIVLFTFYFTQQHWISSPHFSVFMEYTFCLLETVLTKHTNWWGTWCNNKIVLSLLWILPCTIFLEAAFYADLLPFSWRTLKPTLIWELQIPSESSSCQALLQRPFLLSANIFLKILWKKSSTDDKHSQFLPLKKALSMDNQPNSVLIQIFVSSLQLGLRGM